LIQTKKHDPIHVSRINLVTLFSGIHRIRL
jgi:hypothetical protein